MPHQQQQLGILYKEVIYFALENCLNATLNWKEVNKFNLFAQITLTVKTEAANSVEMSIIKYKITWHYIHVHRSPQPLPC